jgi:hypothetical protein
VSHCEFEQFTIYLDSEFCTQCIEFHRLALFARLKKN